MESPAPAGPLPLPYFSRRIKLEFGARAGGWEKGVLEQDIIAVPKWGEAVRPFAERVDWRAVWKLTYRRDNELDYTTQKVPATAANLETAQMRAETWLKYVTELYDGALHMPVPEWEHTQPTVPNEDRMYYRMMDRLLSVTLEIGQVESIYHACDLRGARVASHQSLPALLNRVDFQFQTKDNQDSYWRQQNKYRNVTLTLLEIRNILLPVLKEKKVEQAIVFGSYGRGIAHHGSDLDLLLVVDTESTGGRRWKEYAKVSTVWGRATHRDMDLILCTRNELNRSLSDPDSPLGRDLKKEGQIIYEQTQ